MNLSTLRLLCAGLAGSFAALTGLAVTLSPIVVSDVTTSGFTAVWTTSEASTPGLDVFSDSAGTTSLAGQARVEFVPLGLGNVEAGSTFETRAGRRALAALVAGRQVGLVRVSGLPRGATIYVRPRSFTSAGVDNADTSAPLTAIDLSSTTAFVADAQVLSVDFAGVGASGMVALLQGPAGTVPLAAVVGDGPNPDAALFNLADIASTALHTNAGFAAPVQFTVRLIGAGAPADTLTHTITFQAGTVVAGFSSVAFGTGGAGLPAYFTFDPVGAQDAGVAFTITVRAMKSDGTALATYTGTVSVTGSADVAAGAGDTLAFTAGVLSGYPVRIDRPGQFTLTAARSGSTGVSAPFTVRDNFGAWRNANYNTAQQANASVSGYAADPGATGVPNLLRYAFATGVSAPALTRLPAVGTETIGADTFLTITFYRTASAGDIQYVVQGSDNLTSWDDLETFEPGAPELVTYRDTVPLTAASRRFLRVNVIATPTYASYLNLNAPASVRSSPAAMSDTADPGSSGIPNLLRYAFGLNYANPSAGGLPVVTAVTANGQTYTAIAFTRLATGGGVRYLVQATSNFTTWTTIETVYPGEPTSMVVRDTVPQGPGVFRFLRVAVERF